MRTNVDAPMEAYKSQTKKLARTGFHAKLKSVKIKQNNVLSQSKRALRFSKRISTGL